MIRLNVIDIIFVLNSVDSIFQYHQRNVLHSPSSLKAKICKATFSGKYVSANDDFKVQNATIVYFIPNIYTRIVFYCLNTYSIPYVYCYKVFVFSEIQILSKRLTYLFYILWSDGINFSVQILIIYLEYLPNHCQVQFIRCVVFDLLLIKYFVVVDLYSSINHGLVKQK